jgi:ABC-type transport system involved in multi-copper enzyme maturation permease subunit
MTTITPYRSGQRPGPDGFAQLLHAEWTKFRTVRGWVIGMTVAVVAAAGIGLLGTGTGTSSCQRAGGQAGSGPVSGQAAGGTACSSLTFALGPGGEPVSDSFYFVRQPFTGDGSITVRVTSLTGLLPSQDLNGPPTPTRPGLEPWAKTGIIIKQDTRQGSPYAAIMVAAGHGVRMQWNYTADTPGMPGTVGPASPRWLRLTRAGDVITGYDSADGAHWTQVGAVTLSGLPATVPGGLFTASPDDDQESQNFGGGVNGGGGPTQATAVFDQVTAPGGSWAGGYVGYPEIPGAGAYHQAGRRFTVTGQGDVAPIPAGHGGPADAAATLTGYLLGTFAGLIALAVVATLFMTAEYRRNLIRVTLAASPRRGRTLAAKAIVIGGVSFVAGLVAAAVAVLAGTAVTHARGYYEFPVPTSTVVRVIIGTAALAAVSAVLALAIGTIVRRSAMAVAIVIVATVVPYFLAVAAVVPLGAADWLLRVTPAAGFALQGPYPQYPQVTAIYSALSGYFPLAPWAGLAVLCGWAAAALALAAYLLRRRDS